MSFKYSWFQSRSPGLLLVSFPRHTLKGNLPQCFSPDRRDYYLYPVLPLHFYTTFVRFSPDHRDYYLYPGMTSLRASCFSPDRRDYYLYLPVFGGVVIDFRVSVPIAGITTCIQVIGVENYFREIVSVLIAGITTCILGDVLNKTGMQVSFSPDRRDYPFDRAIDREETD